MDYRVIGHETLELDFDNQKVPDSRRFLCENSGFWLFSIKNVPVSEKNVIFINRKCPFPIEIPFLGHTVAILRKNTVVQTGYWLYLVKMIYLYFIIYALNRWELVIVLFQHFNTTLIILQSLNYSKLSENLPFWPIFQPILNDCYNYNRFMGFILSMGNYGDHLPHISTMRGH